MKCPVCKVVSTSSHFELINGRMRAVYSCSSCGKHYYKVGHIWIEYK